MTATVLARSVHGIEWVCADEIADRLPSAARISMTRREISFSLPSLDADLAGLRTVDDVFVQVGRVEPVGVTKADLPALASRLAGLDWQRSVDLLRQAREVPSGLRFDVVTSIEGRRSYNRYAVEDALGPALEPILGATYATRTGGGPAGAASALTVRVFLRGTSAVAALRLLPRPLHRRAYKQDTGVGTLHPPLAAALVRLAGPAPAGALVDPFAGDGTIAIESRLSARWRHAVACDRDPGRLQNLRRNARRAGVDVSILRADAGELPLRPGGVAAVVTNPPWNVAVEAGGRLAGSLDRFWRQLPELMAPDGRICLVVDGGLSAPETLARLGFRAALATQVRLAGRISHVVLCAAPGQPPPRLSRGLRAWRERALAAGVVTEAGF